MSTTDIVGWGVSSPTRCVATMQHHAGGVKRLIWVLLAHANLFGLILNFNLLMLTTLKKVPPGFTSAVFQEDEVAKVI